MVRGVKLEHAINGSRIVTSVEALNAFVNTLSEVPVGERHITRQRVPRQRQRTPEERERAIVRAEAYLKANGF